MKKFGLIMVTMAAFSISACDDTPSENNISDNVVTETVLDDVDKIEGTISDAMIHDQELDGSADTPENADQNIDEDGANDAISDESADTQINENQSVQE